MLATHMSGLPTLVELTSMHLQPHSRMRLRVRLLQRQCRPFLSMYPPPQDLGRVWFLRSPEQYPRLPLPNWRPPTYSRPLLYTARDRRAFSERSSRHNCHNHSSHSNHSNHSNCSNRSNHSNHSSHSYSPSHRNSSNHSHCNYSWLQPPVMAVVMANDIMTAVAAVPPYPRRQLLI